MLRIAMISHTVGRSDDHAEDQRRPVWIFLDPELFTSQRESLHAISAQTHKLGHMPILARTIASTVYLQGLA